MDVSVGYQTGSRILLFTSQGGTVQGLANNDGTSLDGATSGSAVRRSSAGSTSFAALFEWLVDHSQEQQTALLIYTLLMRCTSFRQTLLVRSDIDRLIVPLLEQLYMDTTEHVNHLYVLQVRPTMFLHATVCFVVQACLCSV